MNTILSRITLRRLVWAAPAIVFIHVCEEAPGFVDYVNNLVPGFITDEQFLFVNAVGIVITFLLALGVAMSEDSVLLLMSVAWFSFVMFANAIVHVSATLALRLYSPGVLSALFLYMPFYLLFISLAVRTTVRTAAIATAVVIGAFPMLVHGYLVIFEATTLF